MLKRAVLAALKRVAETSAGFRAADLTLGKMWRYVEARHLDHARLLADRAAIAERIPDQTVRHGPFAGMRYPTLRSVGSTLFPKLLGSYEIELHHVIEAACTLKPELVVDVGCAEGYYAVGLARRLPDAQVCAFDTSHEARLLCKAMGAANDAADRLHVAGACTPENLLDIGGGRRALVLSDCEGFEADLFTPEVVRSLAASFVLVECHNAVIPGITDRLRDIFSGSHDCRTIRPVSDYHRALDNDFPELAARPLGQRIALMAEYRSPATEWLVAISNSK